MASRSRPKPPRKPPPSLEPPDTEAMVAIPVMMPRGLIAALNRYVVRERKGRPGFSRSAAVREAVDDLLERVLRG